MKIIFYLLFLLSSTSYAEEIVLKIGFEDALKKAETYEDIEEYYIEIAQLIYTERKYNKLRGDELDKFVEDVEGRLLAMLRSNSLSIKRKAVVFTYDIGIYLSLSERMKTEISKIYKNVVIDVTEVNTVENNGSDFLDCVNRFLLFKLVQHKKETLDMLDEQSLLIMQSYIDNELYTKNELFMHQFFEVAFSMKTNRSELEQALIEVTSRTFLKTFPKEKIMRVGHFIDASSQQLGELAKLGLASRLKVIIEDVKMDDELKSLIEAVIASSENKK